MKKKISTGLILLLLISLSSPEIPAQWKIREYRGAPSLLLDNHPVTPLVFWQSYPLRYEVEEFSRQGFNLFSFFRSSQHYENPYLKEDGGFDFSYQDQAIHEFLKYNPDAYFLPRIFATAPNWWTKQNTGELTIYGSRQLTIPRESFASQKCLNEIGDAYRKAVRHILNAGYRDRLMGVHVTNGPWGENFYWDALFGHAVTPPASDMSEPMRQQFIIYLKNKYGNDIARLRNAWKNSELTFESVQAPGLMQRLTLDAGAWRDPLKSRAVMDYFECHNQVVADMIDHYCRIVKEESGGKLLTMVFYGYTQDVNWALENDHRAIGRLLRSENVDMYSSPHTYYRRDLGEDGQPRQYLASTALHGKLFFDEGDDQTYLEHLKPNPDHRAYAKTREESQALIYREFGNAVTHGVGLWYMDLNGGWFRDSALVKSCGQMKKWADISMSHSRKRNARVAVISAPESEFYLGYRQSPENEISWGLYHDQMGEFYRAGAPFDWYLIDDLEAVRDGDYKVCIFLDCFYMTDHQRKVAEEMKSGNRTLVWFYAPGYASQENLSLQRMEQLTGFRFELQKEGMLKAKLSDSGAETGVNKLQKSIFTVAPGEMVQTLATGTENLKDKITIARKKYNTWTSVFSAVPGITPGLMRKFYKEAGIHVYADSDDVISANESWLMIHTRTAGNKQITLPSRCKKITEITTEKIIGENIDSFTFNMPQHRTAVFLLE